MYEQLNKAWEHFRPGVVLQQNNANENETIEVHCQSSDWQLDAKFEYAARPTPQPYSLTKLNIFQNNQLVECAVKHHQRFLHIGKEYDVTIWGFNRVVIR